GARGPAEKSARRASRQSSRDQSSARACDHRRSRRVPQPQRQARQRGRVEGDRELAAGDARRQMSMWILQASDDPAPDDTPLTFRLSSGAVKTIGRATRADFIVDRALVSRLHCRLIAGDETLEVQDLSSTNGTFVNGK